MLQEGNRFIVFPVGLNNHSLNLLAGNTEHSFRELSNFEALIAFIATMLPNLIEMLFTFMFFTCFLA